MSVIKRYFRPTDVEVWRQLESELDAKFKKGDAWHRDKIEAQHDGWTITLDTMFSAASKCEYTRIQTKVANSDRWQFTVYRKGFFSDLAKLLGMQDIEVGYPEFDRDFIVQGSDENQVRALIGNDRIRNLISSQPDVHFSLNADGLLCFSVPEVIRDISRLRRLFDLMTETLDHLCHQAV